MGGVVGGIAEAQVHGLMVALLPAGLRSLLDRVVAAGHEVGAEPYLVGGTVRDLLLGRLSRVAEVDVMVEGPVTALAERLAADLAAPLTLYPRFGTATIQLPWRGWDDQTSDAPPHLTHNVAMSLDLATARAESYPHPGALPVVSLDADVAADLRRRDFTLNAMALALHAGDAGRLIDPAGGLDDLAAGRLSVLHPASFEDDPTRLARGARLAGRLWLRFGAETERLARAAVTGAYLQRVSGERRWHELALLLEEDQPALALAVARALGLLEEIDPMLRWDDWLADRLARPMPWPVAVSRALVRLLLLAYRWPANDIVAFTERLRPDGQARAALKALPRLRGQLALLAHANTGSAVVGALEGLPLAALAAARIAEDDVVARRRLDWHVLELRERRPRLGGLALRELGVPPGPVYREALAALRQAVLDGLAPDEAAEWAVLRREAARPRGGADDDAGQGPGERGDADA